MAIISNSLARVNIDGDTENHHIVPRFMEGLDILKHDRILAH